MDLTKTPQNSFNSGSLFSEAASVSTRLTAAGLRHAVAGFLGVVILYLSLLATSAPMSPSEMQSIDHAVSVLESKGFDREAFLLRHIATFRSRDNWVNVFFPTENAFAATNFPLGVITVYPDFYSKAADDTERAMILLHEAQHLQSSSEAAAYAYVWRNRERLGWTQLSHGRTETYISVEQQTRENAPELFTCKAKLWSDCTIEQLSVVSGQLSVEAPATDY